MRAPAPETANAAGAASLVLPLIVVSALILLGATWYLRYSGYMRRRTAITMTIVLVVVLLGAGALLRMNAL